MEEGILRTPLFATDFGRYRFEPKADKRIIFPYRVENDSYHLIPEGEFSRTYPAAYEYLSRHRPELQERKQTGRWYGYSAPRNLDLHQRAQLLVPLLAEMGSYALIGEEQSQYCLMASGGFSIAVESTPHSELYVLGLFNSTLLYWRLARISNVFRAGWVTCTKQYVGTLPIRTIDFGKEEDVAQHDALVGMVQTMLGLQRELVAVPNERNRIEPEIRHLDAAIDRVVYGLYGLTAEEVAIVEGTTGQGKLDTES